MVVESPASHHWMDEARRNANAGTCGMSQHESQRHGC